ncbi:MAG: AMP-binding protein [Deltaproteobacteria bacterium]|nr:AMP-binding protein [Deltaproteobacteria bacterium]MBW1937893.1 AMP-binding protein [Deltaproteobacteria bacterium]
MQNNRDVMTLPEMVRRSAYEFGNRPALIAREPQGDRVITFGELGSKVKSLAKGLIACGLPKNGKCAILGLNSPEWAVAYLAITSAGGICVPIDTLLSKNEILHLMSDAKVDMAFVAPKFLDWVLDTSKGFPKPKWVIAMTLDTKNIPGDAIAFEELVRKGQQAQDPLPRRVPEDVAAIIYTSGTTGNPKGVMLTHGNIVSDITACYQAIKFKQEHFLSILPMHHMFECTAGFLLPIFSGSTITFARSLKSRSILEDLKASRATVMFGVPLLFRKMLDGIHSAISRVPSAQQMIFHVLMNTVKTGEKLGIKSLGMHLFRSLREQAGLDSLRFLVVGGAPLMPQIPKEFRWLGIKMLQGYGLTEASPVLTFSPVDEPVDESIGKPLSGVEVRILEPDETGVGELAFKGPMIMKGYYKAPEATREVLDSDGWLKTGDLGYQDKKGYLYICGRAKNIIVTPAGKNIYPEEIEAEINLRPLILESIVYGHKTESGEKISAVIVPDYEAIGKHSPKKYLSDQDIHKLIAKEVKTANQALAAFKRVKSFTLTDEEFPKSSTKKIKRHLFKELHVAKK